MQDYNSVSMFKRILHRKAQPKLTVSNTWFITVGFLKAKLNQLGKLGRLTSKNIPNTILTE